MKEWYWTERGRDSHVNIAKTLKRLSLNTYGASKHTHPTFYEMLKGWFSSYESGYTFFDFKCELGLCSTYYDGTNCSLNLGIVNIYWCY